MNKDKAPTTLEDLLSEMFDQLHTTDLNKPLTQAQWMKLYMQVVSAHYLRAKCNIAYLKSKFSDRELLLNLKDIDSSIEKISETYQQALNLLTKIHKEG